MIKRIHVNQHIIRSNRKNNETKPCITVKTYKSNTYCNEAIILDSTGNEIAKVIYRPNNPLPCGAKVWIETKENVVFDNYKDNT